MNGINLAWLAIGVGLGLMADQFWRRSRQSSRRPSSGRNAAFSTPPYPAETPNSSQLARQLQQTELAYQMATEMSQFKAGYLARIAHEIRSPLNGLIGMHQLILGELCENPEEEREFIAQANETALKMVKMLDEILEVSKVEHGTHQLEIQPLSVVQIFDHVYGLTYLPAKDRNLRFQVLPPAPELYVLADPRRLQQILVHFLTTAITHLTNGSLTLSADSTLELDQVVIQLDVALAADFLSEPIDYLQNQKSRPLSRPAEHRTQAIAAATNLQLPPLGLTLLSSQALMECMNGRLEVTPLETEESMTRIQFILPRVTPED